ncbi:hypothetical protein ACFOU2_08110 [Bacillus songklensis]|uniref:Uncharacterized protein n=1 Tax=Bacillus songklensis TaxID=1069116 RepID=A0ABV8AZS8_9BACI
MKGEVTYEVFGSAKGNPKDGEVVSTGIVNALTTGETRELIYAPDRLLAGNYMFKAYQRPNHPGTGELWSESITVKENIELNEHVDPQRPLDQFFNSSINNETATFKVPEGMEPVEISFTSYVILKEQYLKKTANHMRVRLATIMSQRFMAQVRIRLRLICRMDTGRQIFI